MFQSKRVRWSAAAAVAAAVVLVIGFWPGKAVHGPGSAFAAAIQQFRNARTIVCRVSSPTPISVGTMTFEQTGKLYVSAEYGSRMETLVNGAVMNIFYGPPQGPPMIVNPSGRTYTVLDTGEVDHGAQAYNSADAFILALSKLKGEASRELDRMTLDGVDSLGYEISGKLLGLGSGDRVRSELWVDAKTYLPVRYVAEMPLPEMPMAGVKGGMYQMVYDQFEWDTPLDPKLFVPDIPADYTRLDARMPAPDEAMLIKGLGNYAEITGKYLPALDALTLATDLGSAIGTCIASAMVRGEKAPDQQELTQKAMEIGSGVAFYQKLAREGRSPEYYGKTVSPGQADAVLLRWRLADGQWRVIYGDLRAETVNEK